MFTLIPLTQQTITLAAGATSSLTPPSGADWALIQATEYVHYRTDSTTPTTTTGTTIPPQVPTWFRSDLTGVRLLAQAGLGSSVRVQYFQIGPVDPALDLAKETTLAAFKVENDTNLDLVNAELDAQTALLTHIDGDLHTIESDLDDVNAELDSQTTLLTHMDADLHDANASLDAIESDADAIRVELTAFRTENDANLDLANASLDAIESDVDTIRVEIESLSHAEDTPHVSGDIGIMALAVRKDPPPLTPVSADGDYAPLISDQKGRLWVNVGDTTSATRDEDSAHTSGDSGLVILGVRNDMTNGLVGADLDYAMLTLNASGELRVETADAGLPGIVVFGSAWNVFHNPGANTQATVTQAAPGANRRLVITSARWSSGNTGLLGAVQNLLIEIFSGANVYQGRLIHPGAAGNFAQVNLENRVIVCPVNTAATVRFTAAGGANTFESVAMTGYTVAV